MRWQGSAKKEQTVEFVHQSQRDTHRDKLQREVRLVKRWGNVKKKEIFPTTTTQWYVLLSGCYAALKPDKHLLK